MIKDKKEQRERKIKRKKAVKYGIFIIFFFTYALADSELFPQKIKIEDGVRIVHNNEKGKWDDNPLLSLKLVRTVGGLDVTDDNQIFSNPNGMALDNDGCVYVSDVRDARIKKFCPDNEFLAVIGGKGQGPGELMHLASFDIDKQGRIYVNGRLRCKIFSPQGEEQKAITLPRYTLNGDIRILKSGKIAIGGWIQTTWPGQEFKDLNLIKIFDKEGNLQRKIGKIHDYGKPLLNGHGNRFHFNVDKHGSFLVSFIYQNRIEKYSSKGKLIWRADRVLNYSTKHISEGFMTSDKYGRGVQAPNMNWVSFGIVSDGKARIWVITVTKEMNNKNMEEDFDKSDMYKLEVFDPDGILLQEILLNHACNYIRAYENQLLLLDHSRAKVFQYEIVEKNKRF